MTPVAGALTITWLNQYVGPHRVCYRLVAAPPQQFTCVTVNCPNPAGSSNTVTIPVLVDNESCNTLTWEVYVQAECEDINSTTGRVYVTPSPEFVPTPECTGLTLTCTEVPIASFNITNPGSNYAGGESVTINGVPGTLIIGAGSPTSLLQTYVGSCLVDGVYPGIAPASCAVGPCLGAGTFTITVTGGVLSAIVPDPGCTGFAPLDSLTFDSTLLGCAGPCTCGPLTDPVIDVVTTDLGEVIDIVPGTIDIYLASPTIIIGPPTPGPGTTAVAVAILGNCPSGWDAGTNCLGDALGNYATEVAQGVSFDMCYDGGTYNGGDDLEADYGFVLSASSNCCYDCVDVTIENTTGDTVNYTYVDCATKLLLDDSLANGANVTLECVVNNSWSFDVNSVNISNSPPTCN